MTLDDSTPKDPLYKILDELRSLSCGKKNKEEKKRGEEISQDEKEKIEIEYK